MSTLQSDIPRFRLSPLYEDFRIFIVGGILVLVYFLALPKPIPGIPYDKKAARSILGSMPQMMKFQKSNDNRIIPWYANQARENGWPLSQFWMSPFGNPSLILADFREAQDLLLRRTKEFGRGQRIFDIFANTTPEFHIALVSEDPKYKKNKELVKDFMSPGFLQTVSAPQIYMKSNLLIDLWRFKLATAQGKPFDAREDIFSALSDMITAAAFALDDDMSTVKQRLEYIRSLEKDTQVKLNEHGGISFREPSALPYYEAFQLLSHHQGDQAKAGLPRLSHHVQMLTDGGLRRAYRTVEKFEAKEIEKSIARLENNNMNPSSALDYLIKREIQSASKEGRSPDFKQKRIFDEMAGYYMAGHETSATSITWAVKYLACDQSSQGKLRTELRNNFTAAFEEGRQPTVAEILQTKLPYLTAVIDEVLRMRPPFALLNRTALVDTVLLGHHIPKGSTVFMPAMGPSLHSPSLHIPEDARSSSSREKQWNKNWSSENMHLFNPERWLELDSQSGELVHNPQAGPMQSFGLGPRQCFGKRLAYLQLKILVCLIIWNFRLHEIEGQLRSDEIVEFATGQPKYCYVRLEEAF